jgi:transposase
MLIAWWQLREQIVAFDKAIRALVKSNSTCRLLMSVPGIGVLSALAYVSTVEDPARFTRSQSVGAHLGLTPRQYQSGEVDLTNVRLPAKPQVCKTASPRSKPLALFCVPISPRGPTFSKPRTPARA